MLPRIETIVVNPDGTIYALVNMRGEVAVVYPGKCVRIYGSRDLAAEMEDVDFSTFAIRDESKLTSEERLMLQGMNAFGMQVLSGIGSDLELPSATQPSVPSAAAIYQLVIAWGGDHVLQDRHNITVKAADLRRSVFGPTYGS